MIKHTKAGKILRVPAGRTIKETLAHIHTSGHHSCHPYGEAVRRSATTHFVSHDQSNIHTSPTPNLHHSNTGINLHQENREKYEARKTGPTSNIHQILWVKTIRKTTVVQSYLVLCRGSHSKMIVGVVASDYTLFISLHIYMKKHFLHIYMLNVYMHVKIWWDFMPSITHPHSSLVQRSSH